MAGLKNTQENTPITFLSSLSLYPHINPSRSPLTRLPPPHRHSHDHTTTTILTLILSSIFWYITRTLKPPITSFFIINPIPSLLFLWDSWVPRFKKVSRCQNKCKLVLVSIDPWDTEYISIWVLGFLGSFWLKTWKISGFWYKNEIWYCLVSGFSSLVGVEFETESYGSRLGFNFELMWFFWWFWSRSHSSEGVDYMEFGFAWVLIAKWILVVVLV